MIVESFQISYHRRLKINLLAVRPSHHPQVTDRQLVVEADSLAIRSGCGYSDGDALSCQAPEFYSKTGCGESDRLQN